jgi:hypothetical protein
MAKVKIGTVADVDVFVNGDSPFHVWVERVKGGTQKDSGAIPLDPAEAIALAEFLLRAARTPVELGRDGSRSGSAAARTHQLASVVQYDAPE